MNRLKRTPGRNRNGRLLHRVLPKTQFDISRALTTGAAASMYGGTARHLAQLRRKRNGPAHYDFGGRVLYMPEDLIAWIELHRKERVLTTLVPQRMIAGSAPDGQAI